MAILPDSLLEQIEFCEAHLDVWAATPTAIGLTAGQVSSLAALTATARKSYDDAIIARDASKAATLEMKADTSLMRSQAAALLRSITTFAKAQANPSAVYAAAQIPAPQPPTPATAPGRPIDVSVTLLPTGAITLSWNAENAAASSGAFFTIARKLPGMTGFVSIGGAPGSTSASRTMSFTDSNLPTSAAASGAQYIITGQRGTLLGIPSEAITVQFGTDTPGGLTATNATVRIAA